MGCYLNYHLSLNLPFSYTFIAVVQIDKSLETIFGIEYAILRNPPRTLAVNHKGNNPVF